VIRTKSGVISNERLNEDYWQITLDASQIASELRPGQFVHVKISETNDPLFRRPFSVFQRVNLSGGTIGIQVVYKVVGRGTKIMTTLSPGDELDVIGPLGHGFTLHPNKKAHVLLAGGIGAASLFMLGQEISKAIGGKGLELHIILGAKKNESLILRKEFAALNGNILLCTDDGSCGYKGFVTQALNDALYKGGIPADCAVYACGPEPMYNELAEVCRKHDISAQISMERHMMCGIGACLVCVCKVDKNSVLKHRDLKSSHIQFIPEEEFGHALVCKEGPVFNIEEVIFDE
jgi:dihydroorotate dehydrogenase electron transfer subunit